MQRQPEPTPEQRAALFRPGPNSPDGNQEDAEDDGALALLPDAPKGEGMPEGIAQDWDSAQLTEAGLVADPKTAAIGTTKSGAPRKRYKKRLMINEALLRHFHLPLDKRPPLKELAYLLGVNPQSVRDQAFRLRQKGLIESTPKALASTARRKPVIPPLGGWPEPDVPSLEEADGIVDRRKRILTLSAIATHGTHTAKMQAIDRLEQIDARKAVHVGPPPPTNQEEMTDRLARMLSSAPRVVRLEAIRRATENAEVEDDQTVSAGGNFMVRCGSDTGVGRNSGRDAGADDGVDADGGLSDRGDEDGGPACA